MDCDAVRFPPFVGAKGTMYQNCVRFNLQDGMDEHGKPLPAGTPIPQSGGSFFGIPLPGSTWERHIMFRAIEVIVGVAIIIVGVKAFANSGETVKVITSTAKKIDRKVMNG